MILQVIIVQFGGVWFQTASLGIVQWVACIGFGAGTLVWGQVSVHLTLEFFNKTVILDCNIYPNQFQKY